MDAEKEAGFAQATVRADSYHISVVGWTQDAAGRRQMEGRFTQRIGRRRGGRGGV